jgi:L-iditol 2-dehydrogenase
VCWEIFLSVVELSKNEPRLSDAVPATMRAAVYRGEGKIGVESVETPQAGCGEIVVRVETCGICHTDLKKIEYNLLTPPRIYGHETAGVVAAVGEGVQKYGVGDRVVVFHHIPCGDCFYCLRRLYAQCPMYKRVGVTAGFEPAGGGFAQYVRLMDWIVDRGVEKIPDGVSFDRACWVEPVNTCLKAVDMLALRSGDVVAILGQGPIGLIFTMLVRRAGAQVLATDMIEHRRAISEDLGGKAFDPKGREFELRLEEATDGRGADAVIVATDAKGLVDQALRISRPGARILLFAQTSSGTRADVSATDICVGERILLGSYSADVDLQAQSAWLVFSGELPLERLISDRLPLDEISTGIDIACHPGETSLKVVIHPQECR